jgi:cytochrome c-type biogenesis protein CcmH
MDPSAYKPVARPAKPGARPQLTAQQRDALEHTLKCQCPCTLDVFTCRTTDFSCGVSPAMHQDVMRLVDGGHSADDIIAAFTQVYGERVLHGAEEVGLQPRPATRCRSPALGGGACWSSRLMRRWSQRAAAVAAAQRAEHAGTRVRATATGPTTPRTTRRPTSSRGSRRPCAAATTTADGRRRRHRRPRAGTALALGRRARRPRPALARRGPTRPVRPRRRAGPTTAPRYRARRRG